MDELPSEFDLIVVGTGFTESVVAAAASRIGKTVLHLDSNDFYGGPWASFNLEALLALASATPDDGSEDDKEIAVPVGDLHKLRTAPFRLTNVQHHWAPIPEVSPADAVPETRPNTESAVPDNGEATVEQPLTETAAEAIATASEPAAEPPLSAQQQVLKASRRFNIDLSPKLLYARGALVELLISSNICRYSEFRAVDRVVTVLDASGGGGSGDNDPQQQLIRAVPCCRSDIFTSKEVTVVEKRLLSKLLVALLQLTDDDPLHATMAHRTFGEYLANSRLSVKLMHYVLHAIAMCDADASFAVGAARTKRFLQSAERYGSTPFLFTMYGCGEIPQCFCRLCAVFGGVYCLKRPIQAIHRSDPGGRFEAITCDQQRISATNIVFGPGTVVANHTAASATSPQSSSCGNMARGILLTNRPFGDETLNSGGGGVILLKLPTAAATTAAVDCAEADVADAESGAQVLQLSHYSGTCPKDWYLIHLTCQARTADPIADLAPYVAQLFPTGDELTAALVWSMFFNIPACGNCERGSSNSSSSTDGVHYLCGPHFELDYDRSIEEARRLFGQLYADEDFLPRAPDPEEIIVAGSEEDTDAINVAVDAEVALEESTPPADNGVVAAVSGEKSGDGEVAEEACA